MKHIGPRKVQRFATCFHLKLLTPCNWYFYCCFRPRCHSWCMIVMLIGKDSRMTSWVPVIWRWLWYPFFKLISLSLLLLCTTPVWVAAYIINQPETPASFLWFLSAWHPSDHLKIFETNCKQEVRKEPCAMFLLNWSVKERNQRIQKQ